MASRLFSMKYQVRDEQVRMRMRPKNPTNLALRVQGANNLLDNELSWGDGSCGVVMATSIGFVDYLVQFLRNLDAEELGCLEID